MTVAAASTRRGSRSSRAKLEKPADAVLRVALFWGEAHCVIPDGFRKGEPFRLYEWQSRFLSHFYLVRHDAEWNPANPVLAPAFVYRRAGMVGPQKLGKDPTEAFHICVEGAGPALFGGWAGPDEGYACRDHGCPCGWEYPYDPGEPRGMQWPTPLIQVTAVSEDATDNTYAALRPMIDDGPLHDIIPKTSEEFIRLPGGGRIDVVTASAKSRLGQRVTFASQGEAGLWHKRDGMIGQRGVADTQYRGLGGMGGRAAWHTNAWDPAEESLASTEWKAQDPGVYIQFDRPASGLKFTVREERWRIYRSVYPRDVLRENGGHLDLDSVEGEATGLIRKGDPAQAARFYGNQLVSGAGRAFDLGVWDTRIAGEHVCPTTTPVALGFDGSKSNDHTALIATCVACGYQWSLGIWDPADHGGEIPRDVVDVAVARAFTELSVFRMYADPPYWRDELASWVAAYGEDRVVKWDTWRNRAMGFAVRQYAQAITDGALTHADDRVFTEHIGNAQRKELNERDDKGAHLWTLQKETPDSSRKIDGAIAAVLSWEARMDAVAKGALAPPGVVEFIAL